MTDMSCVERLAVAQALYNVVGAQVSTKNDDNLRGIVDEQYRMMYETLGAKSFEVTVGGAKVGTYSIRTSKATDAKDETVLDLEDQELYEKYVQDHVDRELLVDFVLTQAPEDFARHCLKLGVVPSGTKARLVVRQASPGGEYEGGTLKVDPRLVAEAMGEALPAAVAGLLGGAEQ